MNHSLFKMDFKDETLLFSFLSSIYHFIHRHRPINKLFPFNNIDLFMEIRLSIREFSLTANTLACHNHDGRRPLGVLLVIADCLRNLRSS